MKRSQRGFTLLELLITVAVIGILASIAVPNLLNAIQRGKQKRTMSDMRSLAGAVESYHVDNSAYPSASSITVLSANLDPFLEVDISRDGWGREFIVDSLPERYTIGSGGRDGGTLNVIGGPTTDFDDAIIYSNGGFFQWPEGGQHN